MYLYLLNNKKKPVNIHGLYVIYIELFFLGQIFHRISILLNKNIHIAGIHTLRIQLIFTVNKHRRNATQLHVSCSFFPAERPGISPRSCSTPRRTLHL